VKRKNLLVIPVFIPHQGCPQNCLFCNQVSISGQKFSSQDDIELVQSTVDLWLGRCARQNHTEVAFYGGSFTCLTKERQRSLLDAVQPYIESGEVHSIRLSTRPDCINDDICTFLKEYGVRTVELGVQSLDDVVLQAAWRGHSAADSFQAVRIIQNAGITLGIQLMPGLPQETTRSWMKTVKEVLRLQPDCVRIYPTLVIGGSGLASAYAAGTYKPMSMNRAIGLCCWAKERFEAAGITILRVGLQASDTLEEQLLAGPYHPSFGEMVTARHWFRRCREILAVAPENTQIVFRISNRDVSAFVGPKRANIIRMEQLMQQDTKNRSFTFTTDTTLVRGTLKYAIA
jgi:histone acetyltransferase (RNA polymerase elongator complex component)